MAIGEDKRPTIIKSGNNAHIYVFSQEEKPPDDRMDSKRKIWQILPSICASLLCLPFGIMLGWPSPTYVVLLSEDSPLPISMVQSPLIAGFLMFGNLFATPLSKSKFLPTKYGILIALIVETVGWTLMWQATNIYFLLASRLIIGFGNGFGVGQVKMYIRDLCDDTLRPTLLKCVNLYMGFGVLIAYIMGPFVDFRTFSLITTFITIAIFFICFFLPLTPQEYLRFNKVVEAKKIMRKIRPDKNIEEEIMKMKDLPVNEEIGFFAIFRMRDIRERLIILTIMAFVQQFCGAPATIVYCQFMFRELYVPNPEYCAILYGILYFITFFFGTFFTSRYNKKYTLLLSCISVVLVLTVHILLIYFEVNTHYWEYSSLVVMCIYIMVHTLGLGSVPFTLAEYMFPKNTRTSVFHLYFMLFSFFAVIITKLFQVFYSAFPIYIIFCLFTGIGVFGCVFISLFIPIVSPVDS